MVISTSLLTLSSLNNVKRTSRKTPFLTAQMPRRRQELSKVGKNKSEKQLKDKFLLKSQTEGKKKN